jgi:hypothetical protein
MPVRGWLRHRVGEAGRPARLRAPRDSERGDGRSGAETAGRPERRQRCAGGQRPAPSLIRPRRTRSFHTPAPLGQGRHACAAGCTRRAGGSVTSPGLHPFDVPLRPPGATHGSFHVTVRSFSGYFRAHSTWVVALVLTALAALLLGVCDSGGHHRLVESRPDRTAVPASQLSSGCADPDPSCAPVVEQHLATPLDQRQPLQALPTASGERQAGAQPPLCAGTSGRGPPAVAGRVVLSQMCVSRT